MVDPTAVPPETTDAIRPPDGPEVNYRVCSTCWPLLTEEPKPPVYGARAMLHAEVCGFCGGLTRSGWSIERGDNLVWYSSGAKVPLREQRLIRLRWLARDVPADAAYLAELERVTAGLTDRAQIRQRMALGSPIGPTPDVYVRVALEEDVLACLANETRPLLHVPAGASAGCGRYQARDGVMVVDHASCASFVCDYLQTQFDLAHLLSELGFELAQLVAVGLLWRRVLKPRLVRSVHIEIDQEHGTHHRPGGGEQRAPSWDLPSGMGGFG